MTDEDSSNHMDVLALRGVLANALPSKLGTRSEPIRYTVPAVFNRRPLPREVAILEGTDTRAELGAAGYAGVDLKVVDRRLEIGNTNLDELESGLARLIGALLGRISVAVAKTESDRLTGLRVAGERELDRSAGIADRAARIRFTPDPASSAGSAPSATAAG